ncbi:MAG: rhamnulokinase family protein [Bacteroidales bacterium]
MKEYVVAIDLGATSGRVILSCLDGDKLETEEVARFSNDIVEKQGKCYWNFPVLMQEIIRALNILAGRKIKILSVGVDTWGVDVGFLDRNGELIDNPRAYRDPYTKGIPEEFFGKMPREEVYGRTGIQVMDFNTLYQLYAVKKEKSDVLEHTDSILFMPDLISYFLTGNKVCEYTVLSTSQFLNPVTGQIDADLLHTAGTTPSAFPEIVMPGTIIGNLRQELLEEGFGYDIPVIAVAGHDTASAVAAVPAADSDFAYLSSGTWSLMGIEVPQPIISEKTAELNFTNEGGVEGTTRFLKNITGMWILEQCRREWAKEGKNYSYPTIVAMLGEAQPFKSFINTDDPVFANPASMLTAIRNYCSERSMQVPANDAQVMRCIMESLALRYRFVFENLQTFAPFPLKRLHIIGGGANNETLNQFTANSLGVPVSAGPSEATAIGNIMIQYKSLGRMNDIRDMRRVIGKTVSLKEYHPADRENWQQAYLTFCEKCS